jgi:acyl carrier protein
MDHQIEQQIRTFITENFLFGESGDGLKNTDSLLEKGVIDSTGVLELVAFLEEKYGIKVNDEELMPENLDSINNIANYINKKLLGAEKPISIQVSS